MAPSNRVAPDGDGHGEDGSSGDKRGDKGKKSPAGLAAPGERDQKGKGSPSTVGKGRIQGAGASRLKDSGSASEKQSPLGGGGPIGSRPPGPRQPISTRPSVNLKNVVSALHSGIKQGQQQLYSSSQASAAVTSPATADTTPPNAGSDSQTPPDGAGSSRSASGSTKEGPPSAPSSRPSTRGIESLRPRTSGPSDPALPPPTVNHEESSSDDDWDEMIAHVMGEEEDNFQKMLRRSAVPGTVMEEEEDGENSSDVFAFKEGSGARSPADLRSGNGSPSTRERGDSSDDGFQDFSQRGHSKPKPSLKKTNSFGELFSLEGSEQADKAKAVGFVDSAKDAKESKPRVDSPDKTYKKYDESVHEILLLLRRIYDVLVRMLTGKERGPKMLVPILITPVKRLEREAHKSSKRVHFKLRRKSQVESFQPLERDSKMVQNWFMFMVLPLVYDVFAFGLRIAFCDVFLGKLLEVYYADVVCDILMVIDVAVALVTIVPKGTYPGQPHAAATLPAICKLFVRHELPWRSFPILFYQVMSWALLTLPQNDYHNANALVYRWAWWTSMLPRFFSSLKRLSKYFSDSVVDPKITRNVKQFQFGKILLLIIGFAHLIGCIYYFIARNHDFDKTTWIHAFEEALPYYKYENSAYSGEYLLVIFKGFCRVASLGYDPGLPGNLFELVWAVCVMFLSVYVSSLILGTLLTYLVRRDPMEVAHKERLEALQLYMQAKHVPEDLYDSVIRYCEFQYNKNRQNDSSSGSDLIKSLSQSLRIEVANANHSNLIYRCSKIGRPLHRCSQSFFNELVVKLYTVHVMPGDHVVHKDEIPRELYFVSVGAVQVVDEHDQVVSVIRSDVPDTAPIVGEVPFFLGINYLKAMKASLDGDVQLQVLGKQSLAELISEFPEDHNTICQNLWTQFDMGRGDGKDGKKQQDDDHLDKEKLLTKKRILESTTFRKMQQFNHLCKAARSGDMNSVALLARQGANLNMIDYDGRTAMHMACSGGRYKIVECLLKLGADQNIKDRWGQTPMAIAITAKQQMVITVLAGSKAKLDMASPELALCTAAGAGDAPQVKRLIDFGVPPNSGDYDKRTALHVSAAEGHEKIVEFLLVSQADPNCKDRWGGTPLQDALAGGHIGTAHLLKAKGAAVPDEFGAEAVCTAAGKGDVPKLRMLHSFGQSLDVGDYDERYALHLSSAEGRVLAVSFLLGISSDPNKVDRWKGTPMDDCVRGGTLYHMYCAKLLQAWGGELGTFKDSQDGAKFLSALEKISIKDIREVIRKLIDQGLDKVCPERMDDQQLLVVMSATVRHMPLVTQLHQNTSVITKEIRHFRTVVHTFVDQIRENIETVLSTLLKGTRRVPDLEVSIMDDVNMKPNSKRPKTARLARPKTRTEINQQVDQFAGIDQGENSRVLDSLVLESPAHSHDAVGLPRRLMRKLKKPKEAEKITFDDADIDGSGFIDFEEFCSLSVNKGLEQDELIRMFEALDYNQNNKLNRNEFSMFEAEKPMITHQVGKSPKLQRFNTQVHVLSVEQAPVLSQKSFKQRRRASLNRVAESPLQSSMKAYKVDTSSIQDYDFKSSSDLSDVIKRNNQRTDALVKTLFDSTVPPTCIRECFHMLKKSDKKQFQWMTEATEGFLDSDEEDELHEEVDSISSVHEQELELHGEDWWSKTGAKMFNQLALNIVNAEQAYKLLYFILGNEQPMGIRPDADPMLAVAAIARSLVQLKTNTRQMDLDKCVEEVHGCIKPFRLLLTPKGRRENKDEPAGVVRFSTLVAASPTFRNAILSMEVDRTLCLAMKSKLSEVFNEEQMRALLVHARRETKLAGERMHHDNDVEDHKYLSVIISGEVLVIRTLDEDELSRGKCTIHGCFFGAWKALNQPNGLPESEKETPLKDGGSGVNNCVIKAETTCELIKLPIGNLREVLAQMRSEETQFFNEKMLDRISQDVMNLDVLNNLVLERFSKSFFHNKDDDEQWTLPINKRKYYKGVPELEREDIQDSLASIQKLWVHFARGANTVPKGTVDLIKEYLGEGGLQCFSAVFSPMEEPTAPATFNAATFWYCWISFLAKVIVHELHNEDRDDDEEDPEGTSLADDKEAGRNFKGVLTIVLKNASKLMPMDTFTGKADPYVTVTVDGITQKTDVKSGTLEPQFNETMQFNSYANRSSVKLEIFDAESMGQDRFMGSHVFIVAPNPVVQNFTHKVSGQLQDGRTAQGVINIGVSFARGAKVQKQVEQMTEFQLFCATENYWDWLMFILRPNRRIEKSFFKVPLASHEREFAKAVGSLSIPLTGLAIKQYLTYLLVEHSHSVDIYACREFCSFFKRKLDDDTSIMYRDIVKLIKERNSGMNNNDLLLGTTFNPHHWLLRSWVFVVRLVGLYHFLMVPIRIAFQTEANTLTSQLPLSTDLPADVLMAVHVVASLNIGYKNSKSQWVTNRFRIFKNMDFVAVVAVIPLDWIVFLSGLDQESSVWFRLNKMMLFGSKVSPAGILFSPRGKSLLDLLIQFFLICHTCACLYYYLGRKIPIWHLGELNQISWLYADASLGLDTYDRETYHPSMRPDASHMERYILCLYWVVSTITCQGVIGDLYPQNFAELMYSVGLLLFNLTIYRWIQGEIANFVMSADEKVIRTREEQDRILKFISVKSFTPDLRERIQAHFLAVQSNVSEEQEKLLASLSHGLRVELARLIWREFLTKVYLFRGCSGQFLDAVCVLLQETNYGPEEIIGTAGEVSDALVILVYGGVETYTTDSDRFKKVSRKGLAVGALSFLFGVRQYTSTRAARSGAVCIRIRGDGVQEVMQIYPKDEERVKQNALNFYSKDKAEGSVAGFSTASGATEDQNSDESGSSDGKSRQSGNTSRSKGSSSSRGSRNSSERSGSGEGRKKKKRGGSSVGGSVAGSREDAKEEANQEEDQIEEESDEDVGGGSSMEAGGFEDNQASGALVIDEDELPLMKETDHIPLIKERLVQEKITALLSASAKGDVTQVDQLIQAGDITLASKDIMDRTALHIAASEGHEELVRFLLEQKADPTVKDKFGNTPFNDCVRSKHDKVVSIIKDYDPNITFKLAENEMGVLMCQAAFDGRLEDIQRLVINGVDPNENDYDGRTAMHLAASEGNMEVLSYLVDIKANIMCRDRFNGTPLEDAVRHNFEMRNAVHVQKLLRDNGATLSGEGLDYVVKMCSYAAEGQVEHIRLLATNGVDVSLGDYDDRTPLHLAACNGNTAVLEYLLKQDTVLINAVDRFGGTPYQDAIRHGRKGAAAVLEEAGCVRSTDKTSTEVFKEMIENANQKKEKRLRTEREPKIQHVLENSQESKMVATISDKLSKEIANQSAQIELISQRLIWALRGFGDRLHRNACNIPFQDKTFIKSSEHVLHLIIEMRRSVNTSRSTLMAEMQGDEGAADCLIWRNASKDYKRQAKELDDQMRELIMLAKVAKRMLKEVVKVCKRGSRQELYADDPMKHLLESANIDGVKLAEEEAAEAAAKEEQAAAEAAAKALKDKPKKKKIWTGLRVTVNTFGAPRRAPAPPVSAINRVTSLPAPTADDALALPAPALALLKTQSMPYYDQESAVQAEAAETRKKSVP